MEEIGTKAVVIGVSIFITLFIVTIIIFEYAEITNLFKQTGEIDITFEERMDEFNKYKDENNEFIGLDIENILRKYKDDKSIDICIGETEQKCNDEIVINQTEYNHKYKAKFIDGKKFKIVFIKK